MPSQATSSGAPSDSRPKLVLVGFVPLDQSSHWFNELVLFKAEGEALGLSVQTLVRRSTAAGLAQSLAADPVLADLPDMEFDAAAATAALVAFADAADIADPLWARLDAENLGPKDLIYFPRGHPILIRGAGLWLEKRPPELRPSIFFRIIGDEMTDPQSGRRKARVAFYRLSCADLRRRAGQERVFFLVNADSKARAVSRVCCRRPFMMQHHFGRMATDLSPPDPAKPTVIYVHLNGRSGRLAANLGDVIHRVAANAPSVRFLLRVPQERVDAFVAMACERAPLAEILSPEQNDADYCENLQRGSLLLLAYEAQPYKALTSGVFTEAASMGKPVVVPAGTWMAQKIAEGYGVGRVFDDHSAEAVADALLGALRDLNALAASARAMAPRLGVETGCRRYLERMIALSQTAPDMEPRYRMGEEIDFSDPFDSRCFMREGWAETEPWGVWTIDRRANLFLHVDAEPSTRLDLNVFGHAFVERPKMQVTVRVLADERQIAEWKFDATTGKEPRWLKAALRPQEGGSPSRRIAISFEIDAPMSPFAAGSSGDRRTLGLALCKMSLSTAALT